MKQKRMKSIGGELPSPKKWQRSPLAIYLQCLKGSNPYFTVFIILL